ncbi:hypothetical protein SPFL3102_00130 [Sporomusaceae bacterium FL31]|nr:hypothetical protein SPFL3101_02541 [Sporomusaceae bacterium FL31]GCE32365.1 hypothetical protein SPFL3102_00130 [Sporomusaceae bacterium]
MFKQEILRDLIKAYFAEATEVQLKFIEEELTREMEVNIHAKIREMVSYERIKRLMV